MQHFTPDTVSEAFARPHSAGAGAAAGADRSARPALGLQEGERVRLRRPNIWATAGRAGTVIYRYATVPNLYDIQFDDLPTPRPVAGDDLDRIAGAPPT